MVTRIIENTIKTTSIWFRWFGYFLITMLSLWSVAQYLPESHVSEVRVVVDDVTVGLGFFILLIGSIYREIHFTRKEKYANITTELHEISHTIRDLTKYMLEEREKHPLCNDQCNHCKSRQMIIQQSICTVLDNVSKLFSKLTGTTCRCAIKSVYSQDDINIHNAYIFTVARDPASTRACIVSDEARCKNKIDTLWKNPHLINLADIYSSERWFLSNDLIRERQFSSSSFEVYGGRPLNTSLLAWRLPYRSLFVWPIRQGASLNPMVLAPKRCIGFLFVDSDSRDVFDSRWDGPLGLAIADALFHPLELATKLQGGTAGDPRT